MNDSEEELYKRIKTLLLFRKIDEIVTIGKLAVPVLIDALKDEYWNVRWGAAIALGGIAEKGGDCSAAVPALIDALKDENGGVRGVAAWALVEIGKPAVPALMDALKDENLDVRWRAAEALVKIGKPGVPALIDALKDKDWKVRRGAAEALGKIGDARAVPALIDALKDWNWNVRWRAAIALGEIAEKTADAAEYTPALQIIKDSVAAIMGFHEEKYRRAKREERYSLLKEKREMLKSFSMVTNKIHAKTQLPNPLNENEPMKWKLLRTPGMQCKAQNLKLSLNRK
ncbi:MAG: HEAT repeat domain-containing protein [Candidatus Bilamarchaeaceae archaeon]